MIKVELENWMGDDLAVIKAAKESFNRKADWEYTIDPCDGSVSEDNLTSGGWKFFDSGVSGDHYRRLSQNDQRLLKMLARGMGQQEYEALKERIRIANDPDVIEELLWQFKHTTPHLAPFGHNYARFRFRAPVFVMRHIVKHEYIRISELSMRYVRGMPDYYKPKSWRAMAENVKQGSGGDHYDQGLFNNATIDAYNQDNEEYDFYLRAGLCPEQARTFLRLCHMTEGTLSGSMDAIAGIVIKRLDAHAQEETRDFARQIDSHMFKPFPLSWAALTEGVKR